ncbi:MAG: hypothetical protein Q8P68_00120 [Candidatus Peregrinibacteria bacterium]|nr:hypothetical protein [Candidatus Peregrinibacteria bacterium]
MRFGKVGEVEVEVAGKWLEKVTRGRGESKGKGTLKGKGDAGGDELVPESLWCRIGV